MITGPLAASLMAMMGADVVKVEPPDGDPFRSFSANGYSPQFVAYNQGKRSVALDLRCAAGQARLGRLLETADVLIENYRPGTLDRLGFPASVLAERFPRLVHCSITGFGTDGPYAARPAYDGVAQSYAGTMSLALDPEAPRVGGPTLSDNVTGYTAAVAVLAALLERDRTGRGRRLDINMLEATIAFIPDAYATQAMTGQVPHSLSRVAASQTFVLRCADGELLTIHLSAPEKFWTGLLAAIGAPELGRDPRFTPRRRRVTNYVELRTALEGLFATRPRAEWMLRLAEQDVPHAPVLDVEAVTQDAQVQHLGVFCAWPAPSGGELRGIHPPVRIDGARPGLGRRAPLLGEHTEEVLAEVDRPAMAAGR